jgi:hypothetical protein
MSETKPSSFPVLDALEALASQEIIEVDARGRFQLLTRWGKTVEWLGTAKGRLEVLAVLEAPGHLSLRNWSPDGQRIIERYREEQSGGADPETLRRILDRYQKIPVRADRRPYLGDLALAHLGIPLRRTEATAVYAAIFPDRIDLLSQSYRNLQMTISRAELDDLP